MKKMIVYLVMATLGMWVASPSFGQKKALMPITTKSEKALTLYKDAMVAFENVYLAKSIDILLKAVQEDPDFFMANYYLANTYLFLNNPKKFQEYGRLAVNCKAKLSKGEILLKEAMGKLLENQSADVTAIGKKLVEMYPKDVMAYFQLQGFQMMVKDYKGQAETLKKAIEIAERPAPCYNMLGYAYMFDGNYKEAAVALDKYIELAPAIPNPYDSRGELYMNTKEYQKAYESYMKAYKIDSTWSYASAMKAKTLADSPLSDSETLKEMKAIQETIEGEIRASFSGDYAKWKEYSVQGPFTLWMQGAKEKYSYRKGWEAINGAMKPILEKRKTPGTDTKYVLNGCSDYIFRIYKDAALVHFTANISVESTGSKKDFESKEVRSLEKKDGTWKIVYLGTVYTSTYK